LRLEDLARVARLSAFHFHRLYRAMTGESLYQFILRLRLEKAAGRLLAEPAEPVTNIALDCGFGSSAAFARAFKSRKPISYEIGNAITVWLRLCRAVIADESPRHRILNRDSLVPCATAGRASTDMGRRSTIAYPPKTSRKTVARSSKASSPFPVKLEPCMMASVFGFRSASFWRIPVVIGV